jgi:hypothetical protein
MVYVTESDFIQYTRLMKLGQALLVALKAEHGPDTCEPKCASELAVDGWEAVVVT